MKKREGRGSGNFGRWEEICRVFFKLRALLNHCFEMQKRKEAESFLGEKGEGVC